MADYPSALTGAQMDIALLDVAQHNSEAWAVGTRNGYDVQSGDDTFNNNSKHYAEVAKTAAGVAQGAIPSGTAGAVFFDRAQSLTDAQKLQARANIAAGASNKNLLDNPWFTVNQRNFTTGEGTAAGFMLVDRWQAIRATVTRNTDNSLTVTPTQAQYGICQFIEQSRLKVGKTYTMSALIDNQYYSGSFVFSTSPASEYFATFSNGIMFYRHVANNKVDVWVIRDSTTAFAVQAVKLELGSYSTLINDTPPDYGEELLKCMRYFQRITAANYYAIFGTGYGRTTTEAYIQIPLSVPLREGATYTATGSNIANFRTTGQGTNAYTISELSYNTKTTNGVTIHITGTFQQYGPVILYANNSALYIDISADL